MAIGFDRIVVAVPDLADAVAQCRKLLGGQPFSCARTRGEPAVWWDLGNTMIELLEAAVQRPQVQGIVFGTPDTGCDDSPVANGIGLDLRRCDGAATAAVRRSHPEARAVGLSVDHVVLRTGDAEACIELFSGKLGIRLALDKQAPQWGGRMLFFRAGKLTLEVIASDRHEGAGFWGLAYACQNLELQARVLEERGVAVSALREGRKPGTRVATLRSHCLDIPTLLIQPAK